MNEEAGISQVHIQSLMMPFSSNAQGGQMQFAGAANYNSNTSFFNRKVVKPIRGGGAAGSSAAADNANGVSFNTFMS